MPLDPVHTTPTLADFTPLSDHQSQTPGSFFGAKPVLHLHTTSASIRLRDEDHAKYAEIKALSPGASEPEVVEGSDGEVRVSGIEVWVTSRYLLFWSSATQAGVQISYPTIGITAIDGANILLQLDLSDADTADEDLETLQLWITPGTVVPPPSSSHEASTNTSHEISSTSTSTTTPSSRTGAAVNGTSPSHSSTPTAATQLFSALSACQDLNPDPRAHDDSYEDGDGDDDENPSFDPTAPGATGWITSENMADFMDADGNFRLPQGLPVYGDEAGEEDEGEGSLGAGAGRTRSAAEIDGNGVEGEGDDAKWQRTG